jgi:lipooligosaccharide transport system permease protein
MIPVAVLGGGSFGAILLYFAAKIEKEDQFFNILQRLVIMPMFLFSGTFFPLSSVPIYLQPIGWISPLWHATELGRVAAFDYSIGTPLLVVHFLFLSILLIIGLRLAMRQFERRLAK